MGAVSPLGNTFGESWKALKAGVSGIGPLTRFDASGLPWNKAGELRGFDPRAFMPLKDVRRYDAFVHYACAAALTALEDSGIKSGLGSAGVVMGSSRGGVCMLEQGLRVRPTAYLMSGTTVSMAASYAAQRLGIRGYILGVSSACASGACAIGEAARLIRHGILDVVFAGGAEAPLCGLCVRGYGLSGALSVLGVSRPFDLRRDGFVPSEGAAVLVLEEYRRALSRGAGLYGEVLGYGSSSDAFHQTAPDEGGQSRAMAAALSDAGVHPGDVGYISAHATSTPLGDRAEARAIKRVFGQGKVAVGALKSMTGHMLGASGAIESAFALMSLREGVMPPTINLQEPDSGLDHVLTLTENSSNVAMCNSFGFGGVNSVLVLGRLAQ
jgi:3-oxoacyl-[acyl-carrier-protein] synthase II